MADSTDDIDPNAPEPTLGDWIKFGGNARAVVGRQAREDQARAELPTLMALRNISAQLGPAASSRTATDGGLTLNLPGQQGFTPDDDARMIMDMHALGIDPNTTAAAEIKGTQYQALTQALASIKNPYALADIGTDKSVAPIASADGAFYNKYDTEHPLVQLTPGAMADAGLKQNKLSALNAYLATPHITPSQALNAATDKQVGVTQRIKVVGKDGVARFEDGVQQADGSFTYSPAADGAGAPFAAAGDTDEGPTAMQKDTQYIASTLGISSSDALKIKLSLKGKAAPEAWEDLVKSLTTLNYGANASDPQALHDQAVSIWKVMRPGEPVPDGKQPGAGADPNALGAGEQGAPAPGVKPPPAASATPPASVLKEGVATTFKNGQKWTLTNGVPTRIP